MSIIIGLPDERIVLYTKGADNVVYERLKGNNNKEGDGSKVLESTAQQVVAWADDALRTMVFAYRDIPEEEYDTWRAKLQTVMADETEVQKRKDGIIPNAIDDCYDEMEKDLILQGATAIEDKLQEGVPDTLNKLSEAGIKVWMITGDKVGTAKNIALACSILKDEDVMEWLDITTERFDRENKQWSHEQTLV